jgi:hypothetical protein
MDECATNIVCDESLLQIVENALDENGRRTIISTWKLAVHLLFQDTEKT